MIRARSLASLGLASAALFAAAAARSQPKYTEDRTPAGPVIDGQLGAGEYVSFTEGMGSGFGGMIGDGVRLWVDSAADGTLGFLLDQTGHNCNLGADDSIVFYLDTREGGISTTYHLTDASDGGRRAVSGFDGTSRAEIGFHTGFEPDFAFVVRGDSASLYELVEDAPLIFVKALARAPEAGFATSCIKEVGGFTMADVGAGPGYPLAYLGTLINASNAYRSNEWQGHYALDGEADAAKNIGAYPVYVSANSFNLHQTFAPTIALRYRHVAFAFDHFGGTGFAPGPLTTPAQLSSDNWAVGGWSEGAVAFGGTALTGDFARGFADTPVTTPGVYAVDLGESIGFGIQAGMGDFDPGSVTLRLQNLTGKTMTGLRMAWQLWYRNDTPRTTTVLTSYSSDGLAFAPASDWDTPGPATGPAWEPIYISSGSGPITVPDGGYVYVRFTATSAGAGAPRDEIALDQLRIVPTYDACVPWSGGDYNGCTVDACDPVTGNPVYTFEPEGKVCTDKDPCTVGDTCDAAGQCLGAPKCTEAPPPECIDSFQSRTYTPVCLPSGACSWNDTAVICDAGCNPETGLCFDPCDGVVCDMPPPPFCLGAGTSGVYSSTGTCEEGECSYAPAFVACDFGCDGATGLCAGDPCGQIVCNDPPGQCLEETGTCVGGECQYANAPAGTPCDDGDPATQGDACDDAGVCAGMSGAGGGGSGGASQGGSGPGGGAQGGSGGSGGGGAQGGSGGGGAQGGSGGSGPGGGAGGPGSDGCGCAVPGVRDGVAWPAALLLAAAILRSRRRPATRTAVRTGVARGRPLRAEHGRNGRGR